MFLPYSKYGWANRAFYCSSTLSNILSSTRVLGRVSKYIYIRRQKARVTRLIRYSRYPGPGTRRYGPDSPGIDLQFCIVPGKAKSVP